MDSSSSIEDSSSSSSSSCSILASRNTESAGATSAARAAIRAASVSTLSSALHMYRNGLMVNSDSSCSMSKSTSSAPECNVRSSLSTARRTRNSIVGQ